MGCIINFAFIILVLVFAATLIFSILKMAIYSITSIFIGAIVIAMAYYLISHLFKFASKAGILAAQGINSSAKALARAAGINDASKVAEILRVYRVDGEKEIIGDSNDWAEKLINYLDRRNVTDFNPDRKTLKSKMQECILAKDTLILRLQRAGKLDDNTDLGIGVTNTMNRLLTLYNEMKISVDSWRNNKHSFQKATRKMIQYEEELMKEDDPQIIRQLKSALKGCIETHERIKSSRKKIKLFSLQLDMVTTKFENMGHLLFQSGSNVSNNNFLGELDQLSSTIAQSQTGFSESLEELEMDLGDIDFESEFNHKDIHALKEIKKEAKITEELFNSDFFEDI
jgi:hypothetical protein